MVGSSESPKISLLSNHYYFSFLNMKKKTCHLDVRQSYSYLELLISTFSYEIQIDAGSWERDDQRKVKARGSEPATARLKGMT